MDIGQLNKRVTIERPTRGTVDPETNEILDGWQVIATVWASITPLNSRDTVRARAAEIQTTHLVRMRWTPVLDGTCRLSYRPAGSDRPRILNIVGSPINVGEKNREFEVSAVEVA